MYVMVKQANITHSAFLIVGFLPTYSAANLMYTAQFRTLNQWFGRGAYISTVISKGSYGSGGEYLHLYYSGITM